MWVGLDSVERQEELAARKRSFKNMKRLYGKENYAITYPRLFQSSNPHRGGTIRRTSSEGPPGRTAGNPLIIMADSTKIIPRNDHVALRHRILDGLDKLTDLTEVPRTAPPSGPESHRSLWRFDFHALPKGTWKFTPHGTHVFSD